MLVETMIQIAIVAGCSALLIYAALHDVVGRTIPNFVSLILISLGFLRITMAHTMLTSVLAAGAVFAVALLVWYAGLLGGGDVKLLTATRLVVPPQDVPMLLVSVAMVGGMLACIYVAARHILPVPVVQRPRDIFRRIVRVELWRVHRRGPLPYAVAIALGTMTQLVGH